MDAFLIKGPVRLAGTVRASGAKNAALPALAAALLTDAPVTLEEVPDLADVDTMARLLAGMGVSIGRPASSRMVLDASRVTATEAPYDLVRTMRASILVLGPLVARFGEARVSLPGGCAIGLRPVNLHLMALETMGARIAVEKGYIHAHVSRVGRGRGRLTGTTIRFPTPTVTGTENVLFAASLARGTTLIENAAREPEVEDVALLLARMGARLTGAGTPTITVEGVERLEGTGASPHAIVPDRIEAGTYLAAGAITGGDVTVEAARAGDLEAFLDALRRAGAGVETIFENRFLHAVELARMGADVRVAGRAALVRGPVPLEGAPVTASDLRASAALVLAGLVARGETRVRRIYHLDRGYAAMDQRLEALGASVERVDG